ncbi:MULTISPECIES: ABC transporter ATP-binding protein [Amycolatopsis]|uniref:ABC transporter ATP-binding protein n=2 Tax=Amycolatopsis TaxID=1813 RepID=A0ABW5I940_9PSEU
MYQSGQPSTDAVTLRSVTKFYGGNRARVVALDGISVSFARGSFTAVMGPSGSGKSTLLHCAAGLDQPDSGTVVLADQDLGRLDEAALTRMRRDHIGFIFQQFNLLPSLDVVDNVTLPLRLAGKRADPALVNRIIEQVGLGGRRGHRPGELSGGQQQRVAIARALVSRPHVTFADEPTGALDTTSASEILDLLRTAVRAERQTIVMVTHDPVAASYADRVLFLADGQFAGELHEPTVDEVARGLTALSSRASRLGRDGRNTVGTVR